MTRFFTPLYSDAPLAWERSSEVEHIVAADPEEAATIVFSYRGRGVDAVRFTHSAGVAVAVKNGGPDAEA